MIKSLWSRGCALCEVKRQSPLLGSRCQVSGRGSRGRPSLGSGACIKRENNGLTITQSHYIGKILKKFNCECCGPVSTPMEVDIAYVVGKLSIFTSNSSNHHWEAIIRVFRYLKKTMNYGLFYVGFPSVFEGYSDASWITNSEDHTSTTGWVFLVDGGVISWASKKQTCITDSMMESKFVALDAAGKEA
uniref:Zinc finger, CCHC-type n=1 Tax=Tanacetum cinerariifolium TaxID=118510 RepID=A0A699H7H3_TANCI|nr:zinc finger, CCHC-type [Tanacetum cinerariifolium]